MPTPTGPFARAARTGPTIVVVVALAIALSPIAGVSIAGVAPTSPQRGESDRAAGPGVTRLFANAAAQPAQETPTGPPAGRAFVANETGGAVSVIDVATNAVIGTYCLGSDREDDVAGTPAQNLVGPCDQEQDHHRPLYDGHVAPHGAWLTPDGRVLLVANRISGTVVAIDTAIEPAQSCEAPLPPSPCAKAILGYAPTGREPHLATVHPSGHEAWVATRGERFIEVLKLDSALLFNDGVRPVDRMPRIAMVDTLIGPSMVSFTPDGRNAFLVHAKAPVVQKIDAFTRQVVASQAVPAPFTPFGLVTPDGLEFYAVHKNAGTLSILRTSDLGFVVQGLPIGPRANHVYFIGNLAYVTIGGPAASPAAPEPLGGVVVVDRTTHKIVAASPTYQGRPDAPVYAPGGFTDWSGEPHGIWGTADGRRLLVGHERGNRVTVLDTGNPDDPFDDSFVASVSEPLMKQPIDIVTKPTSAGPSPTVSATPQATATRTATATAAPPTNTATVGPTATAVISHTPTRTPSATATSAGTPTATLGVTRSPTATPAPERPPGDVVGICHATGSDRNPFVYLEVRERAISAHLEHGDVVGVASASDCPSAPER